MQKYTRTRLSNYAAYRRNNRGVASFVVPTFPRVANFYDGSETLNALGDRFHDAVQHYYPQEGVGPVQGDLFHNGIQSAQDAFQGLKQGAGNALQQGKQMAGQVVDAVAGHPQATGAVAAGGAGLAGLGAAAVGLRKRAMLRAQQMAAQAGQVAKGMPMAGKLALGAGALGAGALGVGALMGGGQPQQQQAGYGYGSYTSNFSRRNGTRYSTSALLR